MCMCARVHACARVCTRMICIMHHNIILVICRLAALHTVCGNMISFSNRRPGNASCLLAPLRIAPQQTHARAHARSGERRPVHCLMHLPGSAYLPLTRANCNASFILFCFAIKSLTLNKEEHTHRQRTDISYM